MRNSFIEVLSNKVVIPIIQRDYAQGRKDENTSRIRKEFLDVLFDQIAGRVKSPSSPHLELDFIYGFNNTNGNASPSFVPIDGQQRLTTLWLLYWLVGIKEQVPLKQREWLSNFVYETRHSTSVFCSKLMEFETENDEPIVSQIKDQPWYFDVWESDPGIRAMLTVLGDIEARYIALNEPVWQILVENCPFFFHKLDMEMVGLTDDLYIKMNSRGKALTEFEYFKANFSGSLDPDLRVRFELSVDQEWIETVWKMVMASTEFDKDDDIATVVDSSFLNLFNFITSVLAHKEKIEYTDTVSSANSLTSIYGHRSNQLFLFETLDAINQHERVNPDYWVSIFYYGKNAYQDGKTRLFFQHETTNLLERCLFHRLTWSEQLFLYGWIIHIVRNTPDFNRRIRVIRNLAINSDNELRGRVLGEAFREVEEFVVNGDLRVFKTFKTDQIEEERDKNDFLSAGQERSILYRLEDSDILRGSISLIPFDVKFSARAEKFLTLFDEDNFVTEFWDRSTLLLCFGDYSQDDYSRVNLLAPSRTVLREFFTKPAYNKQHFMTGTTSTVVQCLDFFIDNPGVSVVEKIDDTLRLYESGPKDWRFYFIRYKGFRSNCNRGWYYWHNGSYCLWKMKERQFNGYHWDPFLECLRDEVGSGKLSLENYGADLILSHSSDEIAISSDPSGFVFRTRSDPEMPSVILEKLEDNDTIDSNGLLRIEQDEEGFDLIDRIERAKSVLIDILT